jgi:hypothetical protein
MRVRSPALCVLALVFSFTGTSAGAQEDSTFSADPLDRYRLNARYGVGFRDTILLAEGERLARPILEEFLSMGLAGPIVSWRILDFGLGLEGRNQDLLGPDGPGGMTSFDVRGALSHRTGFLPVSIWGGLGESWARGKGFPYARTQSARGGAELGLRLGRGLPDLRFSGLIRDDRRGESIAEPFHREGFKSLDARIVEQVAGFNGTARYGVRHRVETLDGRERNYLNETWSVRGRLHVTDHVAMTAGGGSTRFRVRDGGEAARQYYSGRAEAFLSWMPKPMASTHDFYRYRQESAEEDFVLSNAGGVDVIYPIYRGIYLGGEAGVDSMQFDRSEGVQRSVAEHQLLRFLADGRKGMARGRAGGYGGFGYTNPRDGEGAFRSLAGARLEGELAPLPTFSVSLRSTFDHQGDFSTLDLDQNRVSTGAGLRFHCNRIGIYANYTFLANLATARTELGLQHVFDARAYVDLAEILQLVYRLDVVDSRLGDESTQRLYNSLLAELRLGAPFVMWAGLTYASQRFGEADPRQDLELDTGLRVVIDGLEVYGGYRSTMPLDERSLSNHSLQVRVSHRFEAEF